MILLRRDTIKKRAIAKKSGGRKSMNKATTTAVTGIAVAMAAGTAAYMMAGNRNQNTGRRIKKNASKVIKTLGNMLDSVEYMIR